MPPRLLRGLITVVSRHGCRDKKTYGANCADMFSCRINSISAAGLWDFLSPESNIPIEFNVNYNLSAPEIQARKIPPNITHENFLFPRGPMAGLVYFCSPRYMPIWYATSSNGSSGLTYAFDVFISGIFGSAVTSPAA